MAKRKKAGEPATTLDVNMTPMIDVVFNLIIFFMLVSSISAMRTDPDVTLPVADQARELDPVPEDFIVINVTKSGQVRFVDHTYTEAELKNKLRQKVMESRVPALRYHHDEEAGQDVSDMEVFIRADQDAKYRAVQTAMWVTQNAMLWKLAFGARQNAEQ